MHRYRDNSIIAPDHHAIPYRVWLASEPKATLLLAHGMSEHAGRYGAFAEHLADHHISTWAIGHRGHGADCADEDRGHYADQGGWRKVVSDLNQLKHHILGTATNLPLIVLGHSMGSYVALAAVMEETEGYDGLLLTGSGLNARFLLGAGVLVSWLEKVRLGGRGKSGLMNALTFQSFNRRFKPNRTAYDWLSRDSEQVDQYLADPLCGFACTNQFWMDLLRGQSGLYGVKKSGVIPAHLPILLISGEDDPVGGYGAGVRSLQKLLRSGGVQSAEVDLIAGARHEVLNEVNKEETWARIERWIQGIALRGATSNP